VYFTERGSGPPLLLIHGLMVTGDMFESVLGPFAVNHRVIVPDLRGHGRSRHLPPPYTVRQLAADLSRLLEHLGIESAVVLGYSQGGAIAQQLALDYPARCERLVLACTYAYNMGSPSEWIEGHLAPWLVYLLGPKRFATLAVVLGAKELGKERAGRLAHLMADQDRGLMFLAWRETMAFDSRQRLADIECPTLMIAGSHDRAVPMHHARQLNNGIHDSKLVVMAGARHTLIWTHPDEFVRATEEFLGEQISARGPRPVH
jgi:pimeloyl-ACP methyl ester carboxylesterase